MNKRRFLKAMTRLVKTFLKSRPDLKGRLRSSQVVELVAREFERLNETTRRARELEAALAAYEAELVERLESARADSARAEEAAGLAEERVRVASELQGARDALAHLQADLHQAEIDVSVTSVRSVELEDMLESLLRNTGATPTPTPRSVRFETEVTVIPETDEVVIPPVIPPPSVMVVQSVLNTWSSGEDDVQPPSVEAPAPVVQAAAVSSSLRVTSTQAPVVKPSRPPAPAPPAPAAPVPAPVVVAPVFVPAVISENLQGDWDVLMANIRGRDVVPDAPAPVPLADAPAFQEAVLDHIDRLKLEAQKLAEKDLAAVPPYLWTRKQMQMFANPWAAELLAVQRDIKLRRDGYRLEDAYAAWRGVVRKYNAPVEVKPMTANVKILGNTVLIKHTRLRWGDDYTEFNKQELDFGKRREKAWAEQIGSAMNRKYVREMLESRLSVESINRRYAADPKANPFIGEDFTTVVSMMMRNVKLSLTTSVDLDTDKLTVTVDPASTLAPIGIVLASEEILRDRTRSLTIPARLVMEFVRGDVIDHIEKTMLSGRKAESVIADHVFGNLLGGVAAAKMPPKVYEAGLAYVQQRLPALVGDYEKYVRTQNTIPVLEKSFFKDLKAAACDPGELKTELVAAGLVDAVSGSLVFDQARFDALVEKHANVITTTAFKAKDPKKYPVEAKARSVSQEMVRLLTGVYPAYAQAAMCANKMEPYNTQVAADACGEVMKRFGTPCGAVEEEAGGVGSAKASLGALFKAPPPI